MFGEVDDVIRLTPSMVRIVLAGDECRPPIAI